MSFAGYVAVVRGVGCGPVGGRGGCECLCAAAPAAGSGGNGCTIKGNINSKGQRIYHVDGKSPSDDDTVVDESAGERWFCSEAEAQAAGWRAPKNAR